MKIIVRFFKDELDKYKNSLQLISGLVTLIIGLATLTTEVFSSKYNIALICIGLFFIIERVTSEIIKAQKESFGVIINKYLPKQIKLARRIKFVNYSFVLFPIYLAINFLITKYKEHDCNDINKGIGIIITDFINSKDDDFSYKLFTSLDAELPNSDTINAIRINKFINAGSIGYVDSIKQIFINTCFKRGLLVFGKRSVQSNFFDCNIYLNEMLTAKQFNASNKSIIYLQNPDVINFSIDYQSKIVTEFILGLLYYNSGNFSVSNDKFQHSLRLNKNKENRKFAAYCHFFIGHNLFSNNQFKNAIEEYKLGIGYDSLNAYLHFNLANALLESGDSINAHMEYNIAKRLNDKLINPLEKFQPSKKEILARRDNLLNTERGTPTVIKINDSNKKNISASTSFTVIVMGGKYGVINSKGDTVIKFQYDYIDQYVYTYAKIKFFIVKKGTKFGAVNEYGQIEIPIDQLTEDQVYEKIKALDNDGSSNE